MVRTRTQIRKEQLELEQLNLEIALLKTHLLKESATELNDIFLKDIKEWSDKYMHGRGLWYHG